MTMSCAASICASAAWYAPSSPRSGQFLAHLYTWSIANGVSRLRVRAPAQRRRFDPFPGERSFHRLLQRLHRLHPLAGAFRLLRLSRLDALRLGRPRGLRLHPRSCLRSRLRRIFRRRLRRERRVAELGRLLRPLRPPDSLPPLRRLPSLTIRVRLLGRADSPGVVGLGRGARRRRLLPPVLS